METRRKYRRQNLDPRLLPFFLPLSRARGQLGNGGKETIDTRREASDAISSRGVNMQASRLLRKGGIAQVES